jgi:hypothetical protein
MRVCIHFGSHLSEARSFGRAAKPRPVPRGVGTRKPIVATALIARPLPRAQWQTLSCPARGELVGEPGGNLP